MIALKFINVVLCTLIVTMSIPPIKRSINKAVLFTFMHISSHSVFVNLTLNWKHIKENEFNQQSTLFILFSIGIVNTDISAENNPTEFSNAISNFAIDFYQKCTNQTDSNIIVSPFSVASVLALMVQGADGDTLKEIQSALHLNGDKEKIANQFQEYYRSIGFETEKSSTLSLANRLYLQQGYKVKQSFKDAISEKLGFQIESLNFKDAGASARIINEFVEKQTRNKITDLFKPEAFGAHTRLVAVNAVYFKDDWRNKFDKELTFTDDFFIDEEQKVSVDFMKQFGEFRYANLTDLHATAIKLMYDKSGMSFVIILPNSRIGLPELESSLANLELKQITERLSMGKREIAIPKFKIEFELKLTDVLKELGITNVFSNEADFTSVSDSKEPISLSQAVHKAVIEINEDGAEAAAATGGDFCTSDASLPINEPFKADHPFLYYIIDHETNTVIFSGRYKDPSLTEQQPKRINDEL